MSMIFTFLHNFAFQTAALDKIFIFLGVTLPYIVFAAAFFFLLIMPTRNDPRPWIRSLPRRALKCIHGIFTVGIAYGVTGILKYALHIPRPFLGHADIQPLFLETGGSFPSGHATAFAALAAIMYFHNRRAGVVFWIAAIIIALSRVIAGVHYPIDIAGGILIGGGVGFLMNSLWRKVSKMTEY